MYSNLTEIVSELKSKGKDRETLLAELKNIEAGLVKETERLAVHNLPYVHVEELLREVVAKEDEIIGAALPKEETKVVEKPILVEPEPELSVEPVVQPVIEEPVAVTPKVKKPRAKKVITE